MENPNMQPGAYTQPQENDKDARMWAMFCHLTGLAGFLPVIPLLGCIIGPLIVWLVKKEQFSFVDDQGREALNFQITMAIYFVASLILLLVPCFGFLLVSIVALTDIILCVVAAIKANDGYHYRYPSFLAIRFIK